MMQWQNIERSHELVLNELIFELNKWLKWYH